MEPDFPSDCEAITISNTALVESKFKKHTTYCVTGRDRQGEFQKQRRYKEFSLLRTHLVHSWPGCFVPMIPPKKMIGNLETEFIETRQRLLLDFLTKLCMIGYLYVSEEFQLFIRGPEDLERALNSIKKPSLGEIGEKYQRIFEGFPRHQPEEKQINDSEGYCKFALMKLDAFENKCKRNLTNFNIFNKHFARSFSTLNKVSEKYKNYGKELDAISLRDDAVNPFKVVLEWVQAEILNFQAILDTIAQMAEVSKLKSKFAEKVENEQKSLVKAQGGKKSLSQRLSKKSNEECIAEIDNDLQRLLKEFESISTLETIIKERIAEVYLPTLKQNQYLRFTSMVKLYIDSNNEDLDSMLNHSETLLRTFS